MSGIDKIKFWNILKTIEYENRKHKREQPSRGYKYIRDKLGIHVRIIFDPTIETECGSNTFRGQRMKTIIASFIIDIWTGSEVSLGLKLSNYTTILTKASNLSDEIFN